MAGERSQMDNMLKTKMIKILVCIIYEINAFYTTTDIGMMDRVLANCSEDLGSIPDRVIPKTQKMVLDASFLNTQHF